MPAPRWRGGDVARARTPRRCFAERRLRRWPGLAREALHVLARVEHRMRAGLDHDRGRIDPRVARPAVTRRRAADAQQRRRLIRHRLLEVPPHDDPTFAPELAGEGRDRAELLVPAALRDVAVAQAR